MTWRNLADVLEELADAEETEAARTYERLIFDDDPELLWCCGRAFRNASNLKMHEARAHGPRSHKAKL